MLSFAAIAALVSGLLLVERKAFLQAMLSRPVAAGALLGAALGDLAMGLAVGAVYELFFLGQAHLGAALPEHESLATCVAIPCAVQAARASGWPTLAVAALCLLAFLPLGPLGRQLEGRAEKGNGRFAQRARELARRQQIPEALRQNLRPLYIPFLLGAAAGALGAGLGPAVGLLLQRLGAGWARPVQLAYWAMAIAAAGLGARAMRGRWTFACSSAALLVTAALALILAT